VSNSVQKGTVHLAFVVDPVPSSTVEEQDWLENPGNRAYRDKSFLESQRATRVNVTKLTRATKVANVETERTGRRFSNVSELPDWR
jgi:hypothetical protein